jgi:hypothetical protein
MGLRPKLDAGQLRDLSLAHITNLDAIATGTANVETLWQWAGGWYTWSRVAELKRIVCPEIVEQMALVATVTERFRRTGRIAFTGPEYQRAKRGCEIMDDLAELTDRHTAELAATWSEHRIAAIVALNNRTHAPA